MLGNQWFEAGRNALAQPLGVTLPFREAGFFPAERVRAAGFVFRVERGQRLTINLAVSTADGAQVFLDFFSAVDSSSAPERLMSADSGRTSLDVEIEESGLYLVRIQPELLSAARYTLTIRAGPSLGFPVQGAGNDAIRSRWGADRDGGRRRHEGIDIFAPRGTPVVAAAPGRIVNVGETGLGGRVVWLHDAERNQNLYYAHLDLQLATEGHEVRQGDTLGLVGNTGNARTTPPHLHFGIYRRGEGPIDPFPFVWQPPAQPPSIETDSSNLGEWVRVSTPRLVLTGARLGADTLARSTVMRVIGMNGNRYRVQLPDRREGYVIGRSVQPVAEPVRRTQAAESENLLDRPVPGGLVMASLKPGSVLGILGEFGPYQLVRLPDGEEGWIRQ